MEVAKNEQTYKKTTSSELPSVQTQAGFQQILTDGCFVPSSVLGNRGTKNGHNPVPALRQPAVRGT